MCPFANRDSKPWWYRFCEMLSHQEMGINSEPKRLALIVIDEHVELLLFQFVQIILAGPIGKFEREILQDRESGLRKWNRCSHNVRKTVSRAETVFFVKSIFNFDI